MFLEWSPGYMPKALDYMVVISVAYYLLFPLLSIWLVFRAVGNRRKQAIAVEGKGGVGEGHQGLRSV